MTLLFQIMTVTGIGAILLIAPVLALISLYYAIRQGSVLYFFVNFFSILYYSLWVIAGIVFAGWVPAWLGFPFLGIWASLVAIPHFLVWLNGKKENNRKRILSGIFGISSVFSVAVGILLMCYGATA